MARFVYADNAATTPMKPAVLDEMMPYLKDQYANPSTLYRIGRQAKEVVAKARGEIARALNADAGEIIFTGGGSESDNMALKGVMHSKKARGKHFITSAIEHHAVLYAAKALEKEGFSCTYLPVNQYGEISLDDLKNAIREDTALVSIMAANNEIGTIEPIYEIGKICREKGVLFHTDAVQAVGHMKIDVKDMNIDLLSLTAHKLNGPKGTGALFVRKGVHLVPMIDGGGQERGLRAGTENVAGIVGLGAAVRIAYEEFEEETQRVRALRDALIRGVLQIPYVSLTGHPHNRLPGTASFVIECIEGESLILMLDQKGICASTGSACSTGSLDPSHVLMGIGLKHEVAHGSLRLTLGYQNTMEDVEYIVECLKEIVDRLRSMSPLWEEKMKNK